MTLRPATRSHHRLLNEVLIFVGLEPSVCVRVSSHSNKLFCGKRQVGVDGLRQVAHLLRPLAHRPKLLLASIDRDRAGLLFSKACNDVKQRAFPASVSTQKRNELASSRVKSDGVQDGMLTVGKTNVFDFQ